MQEEIKLTEQFGIGMRFQVEIDTENDTIDIAVYEGSTLNAYITGLTKDQYLGLLDFLQSVAIEKLERPY